MDLFELDSSEIDVITQYESQLEKLGVNLDDEYLKETIIAYSYNLESGIQAFIEYSAKGKLEKPNQYLIKAIRNGWKPRNCMEAPVSPLLTDPDFDTEHNRQERMENYRQLCQIVKTNTQRTRKLTPPKRRNLSLISTRPDLATINQFIADPILKPEMEKAITQHPEWGYEITPNGIEEIEF
ncbi:MAG TPA: hypothetical protein DEG17_14765 [Cyanobacteria bacterium UBA11149]|nr:hypothetical protein [Cyanobacteria bacterium UBA11367]HBE58571.1 hypothetical protein [Cyanobacteria bacterium UBA11366]HBK65243.1 hypothetical protein [Cyanobacteria bacterium UBA11166]HBR76493.1 hypothetical protein [Cyanobacteria bacterium UBA11159]HBS67863.1 hypothetical protein [Cyanobacteria bacterium UBA11153]HBW90098.1 hypothetical protein [Cyanobacteria bacterium UBA11149]HCA93714.1 hypothetical protein [Cyanobacteria bacterium UBA9226]